MAWQPVKMKQTGPSPRVREIISRSVAGLVAIALLYGSYRCIDKSMDLRAEARERAEERRSTASSVRVRQSSGAGLPMMIGIGLGVVGLLALAGATLPSSFFERFVRPPGSIDDDVDRIRRWTR